MTVRSKMPKKPAAPLAILCGHLIPNLFGSLILGIPLCLTIFFRGMACKQCVLNQPIINFETSQSTQGMNIKYLMAGFLIIFALTMLIQFLVYSLRSLEIIKEEN